MPGYRENRHSGEEFALSNLKKDPDIFVFVFLPDVSRNPEFQKFSLFFTADVSKHPDIFKNPKLRIYPEIWHL